MSTIQLLPHQQEVVDVVQRHGDDVRMLIADDTGVGKTITTISVLEALGQSAFGALIVCPKSVMYAWADEWKRVNPSREVVVISSPTPVKKRIKKIRETVQRGAVAVTNYATVALTEPRFLRSIAPTSVVFDEAHKLRDGTTKTNRRARALGAVARHVILLTATPAEKRPSDYWGLLAVLRPDIYSPRGRTWRDFVAQYEVTDFFGNFRFPKPHTEEVLTDEVRRACSGLYFARRKEDVVSLPPLLTKVVRVPFEKEAWRLYRELAREGLALLESGDILIPSTSLSLMQRMRLVCETIEIEPFNGTHKECNLKLEYVRLLAEQTQVVVFSAFERVVSWLERELHPLPVVRITGKESHEERGEAVRRVRDGTARVCLCTYGAGGEGINLQAASHVVLYGLPLSYTKYYQAVSRVYRVGSKRPVTIHILRHKVPRDVIDIEARLQLLMSRKEAFRHALLAEWLEQQKQGGEDGTTACG